jgi:hypothetical protein
MVVAPDVLVIDDVGSLSHGPTRPTSSTTSSIQSSSM